jgi:hypothetical protein
MICESARISAARSGFPDLTDGAPYSERAFSWSPIVQPISRFIAASHDLHDAAASQPPERLPQLFPHPAPERREGSKGRAYRSGPRQRLAGVQTSLSVGFGGGGRRLAAQSAASSGISATNLPLFGASWMSRGHKMAQGHEPGLAQNGSLQSSDIPACRNSGSVSRSSARITGPMRCRVTSQRRLLGSHMPPARRRMWAKSCGQRTATMRPNLANSTGPMRAGRGGEGASARGDPGHERRARTTGRVATSPNMPSAMR